MKKRNTGLSLCLVVAPLLSAGWASCAQPPVILISIDTLRADHLSAYGYTKIKTPNIDSYAQGGTVFTNIEAQVPLTLPSHTSLFTSTYPFENQIEENAEQVPEGAVTLATVLKSQGYKTAAFIGSVFLEREMGLDPGFDFYDSPFHFEAFSPMSGSMFFGGTTKNPYGVRDRRDGALVIGAASRWLNAHSGQPAFVFIHLFDVHKPYHLDSYDAEILYADQLLGGLKQMLVQRGWWDKSLVAVFADHGEGLGDHGEANHGYFIYQSTLRVPLLVHWPSGSSQHPARIEQPAGLIDVAPTILDCLHLTQPPSFEGKSLLSDGARFVYAESVHARDAFGWAPLRSLRVGPLKYIDAPKPELYNVANDPQEKTNLIRRDPAKVAELQATLKKLLIRYAPKRPSSPSQMSPATRALLGSLGYLAGGPRTGVQSTGPDPKDKLPEFQLYERAQLSLANRHLAEAIALLTRLLADDPKNLLARRDLGSTYLDLKMYAKAQQCLTQVLAASPDDYVAHYELGIADKNLGLMKEALSHLEAACKIAPDAAQCKAERDAVRNQAK